MHMMRAMAGSDPPEPPWTRALAPALVGAAGLVLAPLVGAPSHWDDLPRRLAASGAGWSQAVPTLFGAASGPHWPRGPLVPLSMVGDHLLGGSPALAQATGLAAHLAGGALLVALLRRAVPLAPALAGGALFLLHPLQVEAVGWVSARGGPLSLALCLAGLLCLERRGSPAPLLAAGAALLALAGLCSPVALLAAPLLVALHLARDGKLPTWPSLAVALLAPAGALVGAWAAGVPVADPRALAVGAPALPWLLARIAWPVALAPGLRLEALPAPPPWAAVGGLVVLLGLALGGGRAATAAALGTAALGLLVATGAAAETGLVMDVALGGALPALALALAAALRSAPPGLARALAALVVVLGVSTSARQVLRWRDLPRLEEEAAAGWPSTWLHSRMGEERERAGELDPARTWYLLALRGQRPDPLACARVAGLGVLAGRPEQVLVDGAAALEAGCPADPAILAPMAWARAAGGSWAEAEAAAWQIGLDPTGLARAVRLAAAARRGAHGPLRVALAEAARAGRPSPSAAVADLLHRAGDEATAAQVHAVEVGPTPAPGLPPAPGASAPAATATGEDSGAP